MFKTKLIASLVHLLLSIVVISFVMGLIIYFWYPVDYLDLTRFREIALILICVDLVMGPILTFIVFNPKKASLIFDLSVIAFLQFIALGYGCYTLYQDHPLFVTFTIDRFTIVTAKDADPKNAKYDEYKISKLSSPVVAFVALPESIEDRNELILGVMSGAPDLDKRIDLYKPYRENIHTASTRALKTQLIIKDREKAPALVEYFEAYKEASDKHLLFPITGPTKHAIIAIDKDSGKLVSVINIDPWKYARKKQI